MMCILFSFSPSVMLHERGRAFWVDPSLFASQRSMENRICFMMGIQRTRLKGKKRTFLLLGGSRMICCPREH